MIITLVFILFVLIIISNIIYSNKGFLKNIFYKITTYGFIFPFQILLISLFGLWLYLFYFFNFEIPVKAPTGPNPFPLSSSGNPITDDQTDLSNNTAVRGNIYNKITNTFFLIGSGILSLALFTQFNSLDTPIQPTKWKDFDNEHPWKFLFEKSLNGLAGALLFGYLGYKFSSVNKNTYTFIGGLLGFIAGILFCNFRPATNSLRYKMSSYFAPLLKITATILVILGLIWLIRRYSFVNTSVSVILVISAISLILFSLYNFLINNSKFRIFIKNSPIFRAIYNFLFIIPCLITKLFSGISTEFGQTPNYIYKVLLVEAVILFFYFVIPIIIKSLYLQRPLGSRSNRLININTRLATFEPSYIAQQKSVDKLKAVLPGLTWNEIWLPPVGITPTDIQRKLMHDKLAALGYVDGNIPCPPPIDDTYYAQLKNILGLTPKCSISTAIDYINATQPLILDEQSRTSSMGNVYKNLKYQQKNFDKIYNTKQLINTPIKTEITTRKDDWYYGNLKQGDISNYTYCLSCWVFIHQEASNTNYKNNLYNSLINYGDKPNISYNAKAKTLRVEVLTNTGPAIIIYETTNFPLQKWNNIVINCDGGTLDVFINNKLVASKINIIPYISSDRITIGENGGVSGGICNVVYYPATLGKTKIDLFYNTLKIKNPPII